ncbi:ATP-dependent Zn protease [Bradyrhizobium sp. R2.2-H]|jgi:ATP-dependent Zn protease|uniref:AAA family ATPase n=1 Tax=unclassified Bradyrhizobium TaxID=2631580 RepID=UPI0010500146|nr:MULTISPECIES: AAA family ATPase [unclassified Bradyrhizobium]TCU74894.1 ATP-dependent Zn protease [Bradyrhizobium sp. Y-H1]TCU77662.1 ATP-dependent Zn protease [Bradyrhizobium sp. R2.2-H]
MNLHLASPRDLLARAYLDMLGTDSGTNSGPLLRSGDPNDPIERLLDDLSTAPDTVGRTSIRADLAAAAILVARAIEGVDGLTRDLRRGTPVVSVATHAPEIVALVRDVMKICSFGSNAESLDEKHFTNRYTRPVLLIARDGTASDHKSDRGNDAIAEALHVRAPIVGMAPDPRRQLPRDLLRAAEHHLLLGQLDASAIALVIEAVTGKTPEVTIDEQLVRAVDVSDLALSVRPDRSADECVAHLQKIVSNKSVFDHRGPSLEELSGYGAAREWGINLVADLQEYRAGRLDWEAIEKGLLLVGPPGVGKTQFARAVAKSANVPLVATSVADWNASAYLSGTLAAIKSCFAQARQLAPCVLFIDELDGISDRATLTNEYKEYWTQIVNLLLEQLAGVEDRPGVVVIGATNHAEHIDAAVRRAGRLDRTIEIELPDTDSLAQIFRFHLGETALKGVDLTPAALAAVGRTGADVEAWVRRARSHARREKREMTLDDVMNEIRSGRPGLPEQLRRVVALHEAGHMVVGVALNVFQPQALSILDAGGATQVELSRESGQSEQGIENFITSLLGGRAAEVVILGAAKATAGAGIGETSDFARATRAAMDLELRFGFGALGVTHFPEKATEILYHEPAVVGRVKARLDRCLARAYDLIAANKEAVEVIGGRLEEIGYLDRAGIDELLKAYPLQDLASSNESSGGLA